MDILKPAEVKIGKAVFYVHRFPPFRAIRILGELQKVIAPLLGGAAKGVKGVDADKEIKSFAVLGNILGDALLQLPDKLDGDKLEHLAQLLLDPEYIAVSQDGEESPIRLSESEVNNIFAGRIIDMIVLMVQIVKVNYLDFSRLSSVPTGIRAALGEMSRSFQAKYQQNLGS